MIQLHLIATDELLDIEDLDVPTFEAKCSLPDIKAQLSFQEAARKLSFEELWEQSHERDRSIFSIPKGMWACRGAFICSRLEVFFERHPSETPSGQ